MRTDIALRCEVMDTLTWALGIVNAERFISMVKRDTFDYTEWRQNQWNDITIDELFAEAAAYSANRQDKYIIRTMQI